MKHLYITNIGGDEKGSLEYEPVKYDLMGLGSENDRWQGPAAIVTDRPVLSSERLAVIKIWS
jgi:hypothetical protein